MTVLLLGPVSYVYVGLVWQTNNSSVPWDANAGVEGILKLDVYNAVPFVHLKLLIYPLNAPFELGKSFPIYNGPGVWLISADDVAVVPIDTPFM